ncbi:meiotically up-regulated gene 113-domain-containing protein [Aspergillus unguis]
MTYIKNTPESAVTRSDSKNPATTCRGITASGHPCRRGLASSPSPSPGSSPARPTGKFGNPKAKTDIAAFYCWQHKDQAESIMRRTTWKDESNAPNQRRSSIDTLMDRLGVMDINDTAEKPPKYPAKRKQKKRTFCCFTIIEEDDDDYGQLPPRPTPARPPRPSGAGYANGHVSPGPKPNPNPKINSSAIPNALLPWIPQSLSPQTTSILLAELAKPISPADEPGYIYMFWITPSDSTTRSAPPPDDIASSLLPRAKRGMNLSRGFDGVVDGEDSESDDSPEQIQRSNTAIRRARDLNTLSSGPMGSSTGTVRLKIGRTSNVTRRLNEWTRQCSNHLTLIRYYPYTSGRGHGSGAKPGIEPGMKMPHVHRVERLIHLELAAIRARDMGPCPECGKEHREWFEVAAERAALKRVDECIRRWVRWAHAQK